MNPSTLSPSQGTFKRITSIPILPLPLIQPSATQSESCEMLKSSSSVLLSCKPVRYAQRDRKHTRNGLPLVVRWISTVSHGTSNSVARRKRGSRRPRRPPEMVRHVDERRATHAGRPRADGNGRAGRGPGGRASAGRERGQRGVGRRGLWGARRGAWPRRAWREERSAVVPWFDRCSWSDSQRWRRLRAPRSAATAPTRRRTVCCGAPSVRISTLACERGCRTACSRASCGTARTTINPSPVRLPPPTALTPDTRHSCEQGDELASYGFTQHDGRSAAVQVIADAKNNVEITTRLLKVPGGDVGTCTLRTVHG